MAAPFTVVVGPFQPQRAQHRLERLRRASRIVRLTPAVARLAQADPVRVVLVDPPGRQLCPKLQHPPAQAGFQGFEVEPVGTARAHQPFQFRFDRLGEVLRAGFFFRSSPSLASERLCAIRA